MFVIGEDVPDEETTICTDRDNLFVVAAKGDAIDGGAVAESRSDESQAFGIP